MSMAHCQQEAAMMIAFFGTERRQAANGSYKAIVSGMPARSAQAADIRTFSTDVYASVVLFFSVLLGVSLLLTTLSFIGVLELFVVVVLLSLLLISRLTRLLGLVSLVGRTREQLATRMTMGD